MTQSVLSERYKHFFDVSKITICMNYWYLVFIQQTQFQTPLLCHTETGSLHKYIHKNLNLIQSSEIIPNDLSVSVKPKIMKIIFIYC